MDEPEMKKASDLTQIELNSEKLLGVIKAVENEIERVKRGLHLSMLCEEAKEDTENSENSSLNRLEKINNTLRSYIRYQEKLLRDLQGISEVVEDNNIPSPHEER